MIHHEKMWSLCQLRTACAARMVVQGLQFPSTGESGLKERAFWASELPGAHEAVGVQCFIRENCPVLCDINLCINVPNYG